MPIDPSVAVGADLPEQPFSWTTSDVLLYHLCLGAGRDPMDRRELRYATENHLQVLPTFALVAPTFHVYEPPSVSFPGIDVDLSRVLHGGQELVVHRPLATEGKATLRSRIADVYDKGSAAVIIQESEAVDETGRALYTTRSSIFARGEGGFGGERGPSARVEVPDREPDLEVRPATLPQQALWYRLCGDRNPLHSDPEFAQAAGFPRPILHGLCTYGIVCKALVDTLLDGDAGRVAGFAARFAGVVFPGETLRIRAWRRQQDWVVSTTAVERDDAPVLADTVLAARG
ncbi:MAG: MaoC family dehydratase N-terminal domain-containing protein [Actinomycetota bacterium]|nr:MaoC family dehydratase N-terminal domain-containing protein [Actinomycetota bacterium]